MRAKIFNFLSFTNLFLVLGIGLFLFLRLLSYSKYGSFGFGFDYGIYKFEFSSIQSLNDALTQQLSIVPSLLALMFNKLGFSPELYLDYFYLFLVILLGATMYFITKKQFGKLAAVVAIFVMTISYAQVFGTQFYLFKTIFGATFLLLGLYLYSLKSSWFYVVAALLGLIQLPQFLVLVLGVGITSIFDYKKHKSYVVRLWLLAGIFFILFAIGFRDQFLNAFNLVIDAVRNVASYDKHQSGLFVDFNFYFEKSYWIVLIGLYGLFTALKNNFRRYSVYLAALTALFVIIYFDLFFEDRYVFEFDLLLITFVAYFIADLISTIKRKYQKVLAVLVLLTYFGFNYGYYFETTNPSLNQYEVWALNVITEANKADKVMTINTFYAPWLYGFSQKTVLAPGMFEPVFNYQEWQNFLSANNAVKINILKGVYDEYGKYYLYLGNRDTKFDLTSINPKISTVFSVNGSELYLVDFSL